MTDTNTYDDFKELNYFEVEVNPVIEELVNSFIKKAVPEDYSHYVDNDENAAQLLRVQLSYLLTLAEEKGRKKERKFIGKNKRVWFNKGVKEGEEKARSYILTELERIVSFEPITSRQIGLDKVIQSLKQSQEREEK